MRIARHWVRSTVEAVDKSGRPMRGEAWGWSATSVEEAQRRGAEIARRVADWLARGAHYSNAPKRSFQYAYCDERPPREEIVQELQDAGGAITAVITRNNYGALVLNASELMFVDVDFETAKPASPGLLSRLLGKRKPEKPAPNSEAEVQVRIAEWCQAHSDRGARLYRTAAGFRVAFTDRPMQADSDETRSILAELGSDPLYCHLCKVQQCFRARLTPKPWRMDVALPPHRFPFEDAGREAAFRAWQQEYDAAAPRFATCRLIETFGASEVHERLSALLELHDSLSGCERDAVLA
jgi:hypothetical protein